MFIAGEALAQVPSSVTQQLRLSTGGATPNYVNHRARLGAPAAPGALGWYSWDQVPTATAGTNYLLFLNDQNEVRQTTLFNAAVSNYIVTVNATGTNLTYMDPANLVIAQNGLTEPSPNTVELGGTLLHATSIDQATFGMSFVNSTGASTFTLGGGAGTLNTTIDPGTAGNLKLLNIDPSVTDDIFLVLDATGNVVSRSLTGIIDANNGLTEAVTAGVSTISLGSAGPTGSGAPLLTARFVAMNTNDLSFEGTGNFNLGAGGDLSVNINTGSTGNLTLQGTTLSPASPVPSNFLYVDATNNVRRATAASIPAGTASTYLAVDAGGNVVNAPNPLNGIFRGVINGGAIPAYTFVQAVPGLLAGAAVTCTVYNTTGAGTISVQVTNVAAGTFSIELTENIATGSAVNWIAINP